MTEEKICPIMSRPYINNDGSIEEEERLNEVHCIRERCMAWGIRSGMPGHCNLIPEGDE